MRDAIDGRAVLERARIPEDQGRDWADRWILRLLGHTYPSRASVRKAMKRGELAADGVLLIHHALLEPGALIERVEPAGSDPAVFELDLEVVHEDAHLAVVVKVPGFRVNGNVHRTIEHALPHNLQPSTAAGALRLPRPCHRLDAPTGGLLVVAKTTPALLELNRQFREREVDKSYRALAVGRLEGRGVVDSPLDGRDAKTEWEAVGHVHALRGDWVTTVCLHPITGRTHQLRRHLAELGHPILGDAQYGIDRLILRGKGLFLWATEVSLNHPHTGERLTLSCPEPHKFHSLREREERRWRRHNP